MCAIVKSVILSQNNWLKLFYSVIKYTIILKDLEYPTESKENVICLNDKPRLLNSLDDNGQNTKMSESTSSEEEFRDCIDHDGNVDFFPI